MSRLSHTNALESDTLEAPLPDAGHDAFITVLANSIKEWTGLECNILLRKAENREEWRKLVVKSTVVPQRSARLRGR